MAFLQNNTKQHHTVAITDDHILLRSSLAVLINSTKEYSVIFEATNGKEMIKKVQVEHLIPDIMLLDINMPEMDGFESASWLFKHYPQIKVLALSSLSDELSIIKMIRFGAKGYIMKNATPEELKYALDSVISKDFYLSEDISFKIMQGLRQNIDDLPIEVSLLSEKDKEIIRLMCTELSNKEIADQLYISTRTLEDHRNLLYDKLKLKSRIGLAMYAVKNHIVEI